MTAPVRVGGPYFDALTVGQVFDDAPSMTLTDGVAAVHQSIVGDRLRLPLDAHLTRAVTGRTTALAHPGLVCDVAIGQSTLATHHVRANLFYRGLRFLAWPHIGDTLMTTTEVVGLRENSAKPGRPPTGLAALRMRTVDQDGATVLDFHRCAMLPLSPGADPGRVVHSDDMAAVAGDDMAAIAGDDTPAPLVPEWDLAPLRTHARGRHFSPDLAGAVFETSADVVSSAPELARLTLNIAATHHDARVGSAGRLVYGGHTIGLALAQATRALPSLVTVLAWQSCDHTGPVHEGDTLSSTVHVESVTECPSGGLVDLRSLVSAHDDDGSTRPVLDWRFTALMA
ncbi:acyl dehydratase [Rhodococcus rhodnii]|uniref:MaoC family protein n=2 Tax=Rhodococcus rhodnii TaxID=38312 RepID=R7WJ53_9NOCA|nr:MaoC family dehydratase [Rhodococcus rhodnii]EOM75291.1 MaoC family protein [Rhodococcus rhodnii LMG 5362]TXG89951.1 acyl dehydratase [Rhodococcus rhodnii]